MSEIRTLSASQRSILVWCWRRILEIATSGPVEVRKDLGRLGVPWRATRGATPARRAAYSRSLRRLHQRGLILRRSATGRSRTSHIMLTDDGAALAERFIQERSARGG